MDSKSISCDGSRGSSPRPGTNAVSSTENDGAGARLAAALLPVLLHELNNHTQYLSALSALQGSGGAPATSGDGLAQTAREVEDLGWLLGLCAGGFGADWLHERTERRGLAPLVPLVRKALRRIGRDIERADRELPDLPPRIGWRGAWRIGEVLFACGSASATPLEWELCAEDGALVLMCRSASGTFALDSVAPDSVAPDSVAREVPVAAIAGSPPSAGWTSWRIEPKDCV